ncbi:MAG: polysaccharide deacetylase family protein [Myxococcota bacterium]
MRDLPPLVLAYHSISPGPPPLCLSTSELEGQLEALEGGGYRSLPLAVLVSALEANAPLPPARFGVTFDDGYRDFADAALPVLERRGIQATLFVTAASDRRELARGIPGARLLDLEALGELAQRGVEIGAHGLAHVDLTRLDDAALDRELGASREILESRTGRKVELLAYPYGRFDRRVRAAAARRFRAACTTQLAPVSALADCFAIPRIDAYYLRSPRLRARLAEGRAGARLRARRWLRRLRGSEPRWPRGVWGRSRGIGSHRGEGGRGPSAEGGDVA